MPLPPHHVPLPLQNGGYDDNWGQYKHDDGAPVNLGEHDRVERQIKELFRVANNSSVFVKHTMKNNQQMRQNVQNGSGQVKTPKPPGFASDKPEEDKNITTMQCTIWKKKIAIWHKLVTNVIPDDRHASLIVNELKGKCAAVVQMGLTR